MFKGMNVLAAGIFLSLAMSAGGCAGTGLPDPRQMSFPTVPLSPPRIASEVLHNGTVLFFLPDHEVPLVNVQLMVRTGSLLEPRDKVGLAELTGEVMRAGGTANFPADELNRRLEFLGAVLESSMGRRSGSAKLSVFSRDLEEGLQLLSEVIRRPVFPPREVEKAKRRKMEALRRENDNPDTIAFREFRTALYGADPRGRQLAPEHLDAISPVDLTDFHRRYFSPDRLLVGVSGDFDREHFTVLWKRFFGDWEGSGAADEAFPVPAGPASAGIHVAVKDFSQSTILTGHYAPPMNSAEFYPFSVLNYLIGGAGFNSRLTEEIRSNRGLAYSVGSIYRGDIDYGVFLAYAKTGTDNTIKVVDLLRDILDEVRRLGVSAEELRWAKDGIVNNLIFAVDSTSEVVSRKMSYRYDGLPPDFLEKFRDRLEAVTVEDVRKVAGEYLRPYSAVTVVVGRADGFLGELERFGPVTKVVLKDY